MVVDFGLPARVLFGVVCISILLSILVALIAMRRTKRVYFVIKTLSLMLLGTDCTTVIFCFAVIGVPADLTETVLPFWTLSMLLSYVVIAIMLVERCVALYFPLKYLKWTAKENRVIYIVVGAWLGLIVIFVTLRVGTCYVEHRSLTFQACKNTMISMSSVKIFFAIVLLIAFICHVLTYRIIRLKRKTMTRRVTETSPQNGPLQVENTHL